MSPSLLVEALRAGARVLRYPPGSVIPSMAESRADGRRFVRGTTIPVEAVRENALLSEGLPTIVRICEREKALFEVLPDGVKMTIAGVTFVIQSPEEFGIVNEIFLNHCYNIVLGRPTVVIDVGMNIALASLWYASRDDVHAVYGYEPFPTTYGQAIRNIELNPGLRDKLHPHNYGLGAAEAHLELDYDPRWKGKSSVWGLKTNHNGDRFNIVKEQVVIKSVASVVEDVLKAHPDHELIMKIDCEGAEYEIFPAIDDAKLLGRVRGFVIEWHREGPEPLTSRLLENGFRIVSTQGWNSSTGMIYATR